jgi:hypothetical protein
MEKTDIHSTLDGVINFTKSIGGKVLIGILILFHSLNMLIEHRFIKFMFGDDAIIGTIFTVGIHAALIVAMMIGMMCYRVGGWRSNLMATFMTVLGITAGAILWQLAPDVATRYNEEHMQVYLLIIRGGLVMNFLIELIFIGLAFSSKPSAYKTGQTLPDDSTVLVPV